MWPVGFFKHRVTIQNRGQGSKSSYGYKQGDYIDVSTYYANVAFTKGIQAMREGTVDAYDQCMIRMRYHSNVTSESRVKYKGKVYQQIKPPVILKEEDEIQMVCQALVVK